MKIGMATTYLTEEELTFTLTATTYHDGEYDVEELKNRIITALEKDHLECKVSAIPDPIVVKLKKEYPEIF